MHFDTVQICPNLSNSEFALRDHKVLPDVTKQPLLLRDLFSHQILENVNMFNKILHNILQQLCFPK